MKRHRLLSILSIAMLSSACFAQTVSNVRFEQVDNKVKITYSLDKQADISVCVSEDGGKTWSSPLKQVSDDVGKQVQPGSKTIWWDALFEYEQMVGTIICFCIVPQRCENITFTVNGEAFTMVYVQGGTFIMGNAINYAVSPGDETPLHKVTLSDYYIGQYEVTQGLWQAVMENNPAYFQKDKSYPVERVSWEDCQLFLNKLNSLLSTPLHGQRFALPTEAQWEYAARGGLKSNRYKYAGSNEVSSVAWYGENSGETTHPVGQKEPNELLLYDMSGNVSELCFDWYNTYSNYSQTNPSGPSVGTHRVCRGGHYQNNNGQWVSCRGRIESTIRSSFVGLRLVLIP